LDRESVIVELIAEALRTGGQITLRMQGTSMIPAIWPGDIVTVCSSRSHYPQLGEIALIKLEDQIRAHRVVEWLDDASGKSLVTRGDALSQNDPAVRESAVLGTVTEHNGHPLRRGPSRMGRWLALERLLALIGFLWFHARKLRGHAAKNERAHAYPSDHG
jgi:hypothetical protein